jgi:hypothetical protein
MLTLSINEILRRFGPPHLTDIGGKVSAWWGFRTEHHRWSVYKNIGDDELHIGGTTPTAVWIVLAVLRIQGSDLWHPSECPRDWWGQLYFAEVPRITTKETP